MSGRKFKVGDRAVANERAHERCIGMTGTITRVFEEMGDYFVTFQPDPEYQGERIKNWFEWRLDLLTNQPRGQLTFAGV